MTSGFLLQSAIKMSCIILAALIASAVLRNGSAALRHWILAAAIVSAAAAPFVEPLLPSWNLPGIAFDRRSFTPNDLRQAERTARVLSEVQGPAANAVRPEAHVSLDEAFVGLWITGVAIGVLMLAAGLCRVWRISSRARRVDGEWARQAASSSREMGLRRPVAIRRTDLPALLFTCGFLRPVIVVPVDAESWTPARIRVVLAHELAHAKRGDWVIQLVAEIVRAVCWFNPVVWIACWRLRQESEQAADDAVIGRGIEGAEYAAHLVEVARAFAREKRSWLPAPAILRASSFERRISAMLNARANRRPVSTTTRLATVAALATVAIAIASAQGLFSTFSGAVYDPLNGLLPGVRMMLTNAQTGAKYEVRTDGNGRFNFVGLPPGRYGIETELPGFKAMRGSVDIGGQDVQRDMTLAIGSLQETVSVARGMDAVVERGTRPRVMTGYAPACTSAPQPGGIGGNLRAPTKLVHAVPRFPASLSGSSVGGVVVLEAIIGADGTIQNVRTVSSSHPDFEASAVDAVRQWEFSQTLLNCVPVEVAMTVTVNFAAR